MFVINIGIVIDKNENKLRTTVKKIKHLPKFKPNKIPKNAKNFQNTLFPYKTTQNMLKYEKNNFFNFNSSFH